MPIEVALSDLMTPRSKKLLFATLLVTNVFVAVGVYLLTALWIEHDAARAVTADVAAVGGGAVVWRKRT